MNNLKDFLSGRQVAIALGVQPATVLRWIKDGKIKTIRHPVSDRLYLIEKKELERILGELNK